MSATISNAEKNVGSVKKAETIVSRHNFESESDPSLSPIERARRACQLSQNEEFSLIDRILTVR